MHVGRVSRIRDKQKKKINNEKKKKTAERRIRTRVTQMQVQHSNH